MRIQKRGAQGDSSSSLCCKGFAVSPSMPPHPNLSLHFPPTESFVTVSPAKHIKAGQSSMSSHSMACLLTASLPILIELSAKSKHALPHVKMLLITD